MTTNSRSILVGHASVTLALVGLVFVASCSGSSEATTSKPTSLVPSPTSSASAVPRSTTTGAVGGTTTSTPATTASVSPPTDRGEPPSTTASTVAPPNMNPSGIEMPVTDLQSLRLVFTDDFSKYGDVPLGQFPGATGGRWGGYGPGVPDTTGFGQYDMERTVSIIGGVLDIWLHTADGVHYVAAPWPVLPGTQSNSLWYGRIEFAFRAEPVEGYKTAWLLWPDSGNGRRDGEIDFPEGDLDGIASISGFMHRQGAKHGGDQDVRTDGVYANNVWHRAAIVWMPNDCEFWLDGVQLGTTITKRVPRTPMHWIFQTETALDFSTPPPADSSGHVQLDWVAMWQYDPTVAAP